MATLSTVATEARRLDPDRFLGALFAPDPLREDLWSLIAFDGTLAEVPASVSEPGLGLIRLQWWRESIVSAANPDATSPQPVIAALAEAISRHQLTPDVFEPLLAARERELEGPPPADMAELEQHIDILADAFSRIALHIAGAASQATHEAVARISGAHALVRLAFTVPACASHGRLHLPPAEGVHPDFQGMAAAIERICARARTRLVEARAMRPTVDRAAMSLLLPAVLIEARLNALAAAAFDPYRVHVNPSATRILRLAWASVRARY